jgi:Mg2+ and Co2+ transporter CorA
METSDKAISRFLLEITAKQKKRIERLTQFLTQAEDIILNAYELDNIPTTQIPELAKTVNKLQKVLYDSLELMRKMVAGNIRVPQSGTDEEIEEIAYLLRTLEPDQVEKLKEQIMEVKPQLRLTRRGKASPGSLDEPGE